MMNRRNLCLVVPMGLAAPTSFCLARPSPPAEPAPWRTTLVVAKGTSKPGLIQSVSDQFSFDGRIYAHATLVAVGAPLPVTETFSMKWFNGDQQVHERSGPYLVQGSPYYLVHAVPGSVLGVGACRVELHCATGLLASRAFMVSER